MNFKMKALVAAAVAAMSVSGVASAALDNAPSGTGENSSIVLSLYDKANNVSALFDLGYNYQTFAFGGTQSASSASWNLASGDYAEAWSTFFSSADVANIQWGVVGADYAGLGDGARGVISTYNTKNTITSINTVNLNKVLMGVNNYITANQNKGNHLTVENGASVALGQGTDSAFTIYKSGNIVSNGTYALAGLGQTQGVIQYTSGASSLKVGPQYIYDATFTLGADGVLRYTVAAVPEPETYALLLAGLGLVGAAARRRKSA